MGRGTTSSELWLGIDIGTQSVRVFAVNLEGDVEGSGRASLRSSRAKGRHTQEPNEWWDAVVLACKECLIEIDSNRVEGLSVAATSGTILLADSTGQPCSSGLMYDDLRGGQYLDRVNEIGESVWVSCGYKKMQPSWALPKLLWLMDNIEVASSCHLMHQSDYVNRMLTGHRVATDLSSALKSGVNTVAEEWPTRLLEDLGVPASSLPPVVRSGTKLGEVSHAAAEATGLQAGTSVVASTTDGCAAQLAAGAVTPGSWNSVLGTTLVLKGVTEDLLKDSAGVVYAHRSPLGTWLPGGASNSGAGYLTRSLGHLDLNAVSQAAQDLDEVKLGAVTYPLVSEGERFPFVAPAARTFTISPPKSNSLNVDSELGGFVAALLGLAFVERLAFEYLEQLGASIVGPIVFTGGGAQNRHWNQIRSNVLGRQIALPVVSQPAIGAAALAASETSDLQTVTESMIKISHSVSPIRPQYDYDHLYRTFVDELVERGWFQRRHKIRMSQ